MANLITPYFRMNFPNLFKAKKNGLSDKEEYSVQALFPVGADLSKLKEAAQAAIIEKWGADQTKWPKNLRSPFRKQEERAEVNDSGIEVLPAGHVKGAIFMNFKCNAKNRPQIIDANREDILDEAQIYSGCWARASVNAYAYDKNGNRGVSFGLQNIQKIKDDEPLAGRVKATDEFAPVEMAVNAGGASAGGMFD